MAGKRAGLDGERSGLFMEQIRIIKELRQNDRNHGRTGMLVRPRYCIWENVPGALSSNGGKDFQTVLTEFVKICVPDAPLVPIPVSGKWPNAGVIYDPLGKWSLAYRVHDAQYWGVPQRRRRIAVLCDFNGLSAGGGCYLTINCGEKPRTPIPSKLSEILVDDPDPKYRLSPKACQGILNRAKKRGKELPPELHKALVEQSVSRNEPGNLGGQRNPLAE